MSDNDKTPPAGQGAEETPDNKDAAELLAEGVDEEVIESNRRLFTGWQWALFGGLAVAYSLF
ncbi:hypothetical protein IEI94_09595, partial [Halomonas sp. ML-15]|uniref:hypothetical protein n=1 Tax=Halomonas sp. ML-15 TaxID=2773305 RepID=UPI001746C4D3